MSIKRQLRQWGYELAQLWGQLSFGGRITAGALFSIALAVSVTRTVTAPLSKEVATLKRNVIAPDNLEPDKDEEVLMNREKESNIRGSLVTWKERLNALKKGPGVFDESLHAAVIAEIQKIFDRCGVQILAETFVPENSLPINSPAPRPRKGVLETKTKAEAPAGAMGIFVHTYRVRGSFRQLQASLLLLEQSPSPLHLHGLRLLSEADPEQPLLTLSFTLNIRYLKKSPHAH